MYLQSVGLFKENVRGGASFILIRVVQWCKKPEIFDLLAFFCVAPVFSTSDHVWLPSAPAVNLRFNPPSTWTGTNPFNRAALYSFTPNVTNSNKWVILWGLGVLQARSEWQLVGESLCEPLCFTRRCSYAVCPRITDTERCHFLPPCLCLSATSGRPLPTFTNTDAL